MFRVCQGLIAVIILLYLVVNYSYFEKLWQKSAIKAGQQELIYNHLCIIKAGSLSGKYQPKQTREAFRKMLLLSS